MLILTLTLQILALVYHQVTTRFDLYPFNGIRAYTKKERNMEALSNGLIMSLPVILTLFSNPYAVGIAAAVWSMIIVGAILSWWLPYATGIMVYKYPNGETWPQIYSRIFAQTIVVLPRLRDIRKPTPNLEHMILHVLIVGSAATAWIYAFHI